MSFLNSRRLSTLAALTIALLFTMNAGLNVVVAQSPIDYDADDDGLIEIQWLEQLDAIRWDLDGSGLLALASGRIDAGALIASIADEIGRNPSALAAQWRLHTAKALVLLDGLHSPP